MFGGGKLGQWGSSEDFGSMAGGCDGGQDQVQAHACMPYVHSASSMGEIADGLCYSGIIGAIDLADREDGGPNDSQPPPTYPILVALTSLVQAGYTRHGKGTNSQDSSADWIAFYGTPNGRTKLPR